MALHELPAQLRPRERLFAHGAASLADSELLALLLRTGIAGKNVLELAQELIHAFDGIGGLLHARPEQLARIKGLGGKAKRSQLMAVLELSRRVLQARLRERPLMNDVEGVQQYVQLRIGALQHEVFHVLFLDSRHQLIADEELFRGTLDHVNVHPRQVVKRALQHEAAALILAHNHPSGAVEPSSADRSITDLLKAALALVEVRVIDHLIVGGGRSYSFARIGYL